MARVNAEVRKEVVRLIDEIPEEILSTCGLCNRTLYDQLVSIATQADAPQKTVCDLFASRYNEGKAEHDHVTGQAFLERIKWINRANKQELSGETTKDSERGVDKSVGPPVGTDCVLCGDSHQITEETTCELNADGHQSHDESDTMPECEELAEPVDEAQDTNAEVHGFEEPVETVSTEPSPNRIFIPPGISQADLAAGLAGFFESKRYSSAFLLKTCLMAMNGMVARMDVSEIKKAIDEWHSPSGQQR